MADLHHIEATIAGAADAVVQDAIAYVRQHPQYQQIITQLGEKAIQALLQGL